MAKCLETRKACQHLDARLAYGFNWTAAFARHWQADFPFALNVAIRPAGAPSGFQYSSSGGQSGADEPPWPTVIAQAVIDGPITWTAEAIDTDSLADTIVSDSWAASVPAGLTVQADAPFNTAGLQRTSAILSGGVAGTTYVIENTVITSLGHEYVARILLTVI